MYNDQGNMAKPIPTNEPDFQRLISLLRQELSKAEELCKMTNNVACILKPYIPNNNNEIKGSLNEKSEGIIGVLFQEINRLILINSYNESNYNHLKEIIGN